MIRDNCLWAILGVCGSLLVVAVPTATRAAEPEAQHASAWDSKVVCHRVNTPGSRTREKECATREEWRARSDMKVVCRWGTRPGAQTKEQFCLTVALWQALGIPNRTSANSHGSYSHGSTGTSPAVPGNSNFGGTAASQSSFQR